MPSGEEVREKRERDTEEDSTNTKTKHAALPNNNLFMPIETTDSREVLRRMNELVGCLIPVESSVRTSLLAVNVNLVKNMPSGEDVDAEERTIREKRERDTEEDSTNRKTKHVRESSGTLNRHNAPSRTRDEQAHRPVEDESALGVNSRQQKAADTYTHTHTHTGGDGGGGGGSGGGGRVSLPHSLLVDKVPITSTQNRALIDP
jgi:hypothetical protein